MQKEFVSQVVHLRRAAQSIDPSVARDDIGDRLQTATDTLKDFSDQDVATQQEVYDALRGEAKDILRNKLEVEAGASVRVSDRFGYSEEGFGNGTTLDDLIATWSADFNRSYKRPPNQEENVLDK